MRNVIWAVVAFGAVAAIDATPALARDYPFCIKGRDYQSGLGDCSFDTYRQCQASASGRFAYCTENPFFRYNGDPQSRRTYRHRRHYR